MSLSVGTLFLSATGYLLLLFLIAYATERWLPIRVTSHPLVYILSLGVYATTWSYYGSVGFAAEQGVLYLTIYLGVFLTFVLTPVLLMPLLRLTRTHQLTSVADLFAFRFNSQLAGVLVTLMMLAGILPYIALQIRAVAESTRVLSPATSPVPVAVVFCVMVTVFAVIFGARHVTPREKHTGLVMAIAFESLIKLLILLTLAAVALWMAFGSPAGLDAWLAEEPERLQHFYAGAVDGPWESLLLITFAAAFLLPRQFHMIFTENLRASALLTASWGFPLYLMLVALAIPPILWAGQVLMPEATPDYYVLGIAQLAGSPLLAILAYLGGISAASAMIIVATLALSSMFLNHLVLPFIRPQPQRDLYAALRWARRAATAAMIGAGYLFYEILQRTQGLVEWGLISFLAMAQFLPGLVGVLYWQRATRTGFVAGLLAGGTLWGLGALWPVLTGEQPLAVWGLTGYGSLTFLSLTLNTLLFTVGSLLTLPTERERRAAAACRDVSTRPPEGAPRARNPAQFVARLAPVTGDAAARQEVGKALADLDMGWEEQRPERLHQLREQIERNLSGMMGPVLARMIVDDRLQLDTQTRTALAQSVRMIEERLESSRARFYGVAAELDHLRRYHRQILEDLPLGIVAIAANGRIARWNPAMSALSGISASRALGSTLRDLPAPWGQFLDAFLNQTQDHAHKQALRSERLVRWFTLHKTAIGAAPGAEADRLLLIEEVTELERLERELTHSERLASIGRLAAGVAHEVGNPVTGIACLAQDLKLDLDDPAALEQGLEEILEQTKRISNIVHTLVSYAHGENSEQPMHPLPLAEAVNEAVRLVRLSQRARALNFVNRIDAHLLIPGNRQRLVQVFVNLFSNSADACGPGGQVTIDSRRLGDSVEVVVIDNGPGIPEHLQEQVLEPFFTTKPAGKGTGLGLPLAHNIIKEHEGELEIEAMPAGTRVILRLPLMEVEPSWQAS